MMFCFGRFYDVQHRTFRARFIAQTLQIVHGWQQHKNGIDMTMTLPNHSNRTDHNQ